MWVAKLQTQLREADKNPLLQGWAAGGLRERIDEFIVTGDVCKILEGVDINQKVLLHGDLSMSTSLPLSLPSPSRLSFLRATVK